MTRILLTAGLVLCMASGVFAQMPAKGLQADLADQVKQAGDKLVALAEKMTQEQYAWRPMEGVRSVSEVYKHAATSTVNILRMAGIEPPMKVDRNMVSSMTNKAEVIDLMKKAFKHAEDAIVGYSGEDLGKATKVFGQDGTNQSVLVLVVAHVHEHLGQSIAYARANKVVPPWSQGGGM